MCMGVCAYVCVMCAHACVFVCVCAQMCVCVQEMERESNRGSHTRESAIMHWPTMKSHLTADAQLKGCISHTYCIDVNGAGHDTQRALCSTSPFPPLHPPVQVLSARCLPHNAQLGSGGQRFVDNQPRTVASGICRIGRLRRKGATVGDAGELVGCPGLKLIKVLLTIDDQLHLRGTNKARQEKWRGEGMDK